MTSQIAWLDSTPEEQKAARELVAMFDEQESRDELGIGPIRDAFSDLLFPGTSVLQTRARYFLFVPWCYTAGRAARAVGDANRTRGREQERHLIKALKNCPSPDKRGLIGARVGVNVINLPSGIYWNGMRRYGIREYSGEIGSVLGTHDSSEGATELADRVAVEWNRTIPAPPPGFPDDVPDGFAMRYPEAEWLRERMSTHTEGTVLAHLLEEAVPIDDGALSPWDAVGVDDFEPLHHARMFSGVMHGAALLYNLIIAERFTKLGFEKDEDLVELYVGGLEDWQSDFLGRSRVDVEAWDLDAMWRLVKDQNHRIHPQTQGFVTKWIEILRHHVDPITDNGARELVELRERRKGSQSRMKNDKLLETWSGASGTGALTYRWGTVRRIVNDITTGLDDASS